MKLFLPIIAIFLISSCTKKSLGKEKYVQWCNKNLIVKKEMDKYSFDVRAVTQDYRTAMDKQEGIQKTLGQLYITVKIGNSGGEESLLGSYNTAEFNETLTYFIEQAKQDFTFITGGDTLKPSLYHFERLYNIANFSVIDLVFETKPNQKLVDSRLVYDDNKLNIGKLTVPFPNLDSEKMPVLIQ